MPWIYELRGAENRLVEIRSGFSTEKDARNAGLRAKRLVDCICYPNPETLMVVIKEGESTTSRWVEMPAVAGESSSLGSPEGLRYPWQQLVLDAFRESHPKTCSSESTSPNEPSPSAWSILILSSWLSAWPSARPCYRFAGCLRK